MTILDEEQDWRALERIDCPTLVVRPHSDGYGGDLAWPRRITAALPDARLVLVPNSAHVVPLDNPRGLVEALRGFV